MDATRDDHPDEGTIHAWLDGAFDAATAEAIEAHVRSCPSCAARVAEARGLIAGASRVVSALDDVPSGVTPAWGRAPAAAPTSAPGSRSTWRHVTPGRAAIAATILVALGVTLTRQRIAPEAELARSGIATASSASRAPVLPHDTLLKSAVKQNVEASNPPRAIRAAPGADVAVPLAAAPPAGVVGDSTARARVAVARGALRAQRDSPSVVADRAAVETPTFAGAPARVADADRRETAASLKADAVGQSVPVRRDVAVRPASTALECYRVESANGTPAQWGTVSLPFVVTLDSAGRLARLTGADGSTAARAIWTKGRDDSLTFQLRRLGYTGTLALGGTGEVRPGVMRSSQNQLQLEEAVTSAAEPRAEKRTAARGRAAPSAAAAAPAPRSAETVGAPATAVVARRISCQS